MEFSVQNLCGFLIRSKLMSPENMRAMQQRWQSEAKDQAGNSAQFTKWLVANKYVTEYQASLLAKGHADDFFLNQYMILERLGRGRMAGVYKAAHPLGQIVAIKVVPPSRAKNALVMGRFQREARLSIKLRHPNVVRSFQVGQMGPINYLVMEYLEGETLDEVLQRRKRMYPAEAVRLIHQALTGLQHIHEQGMVHRDLKPANLMLVPAPGPGDPDTTYKATVKILDIGLARQMFEEMQPAAENRIDLTAEGVLLGTPDYLAPEQARDARSIDIRADIYSLGCVLYHLLTGQPPFPDSSIISQLIRHANEAPKPLKTFNPQIPDGLQQIINWMMAKQADQRYPTPERAAQALQMFLLADNVPAKPLEDAPQLRKYLTWLEVNNQDSESETVNLPAAGKPTAAKPASNPAVAAPRQASPPMPVASPIRSSRTTPRPPHRREKKHKRSKHRDQVARAAGALPMVLPLGTAPPPQFDVELVPAMSSATILAPPTAAGSRFARRDWILLSLGSGVMLLLIVVFLLIVLLSR